MESIINLIENNKFYELVKIIETYDEFIDRSFPPVELENFFDITGISKNYKLPFNLDGKHLEALSYNFMYNEKITNLIFNELLKLNKELEIFTNVHFHTDNHYEKCAVISGACSKMNIEDIKDFIYSDNEIVGTPKGDVGYIIQRNNNTDEYNYLYNKVCNYGTYICYFPSTNTLKYIINSQD